VPNISATPVKCPIVAMDPFSAIHLEALALVPVILERSLVHTTDQAIYTLTGAPFIELSSATLSIFELGD